MMYRIMEYFRENKQSIKEGIIEVLQGWGMLASVILITELICFFSFGRWVLFSYIF